MTDDIYEAAMAYRAEYEARVEANILKGIKEDNARFVGLDPRQSKAKKNPIESMHWFGAMRWAIHENFDVPYHDRFESPPAKMMRGFEFVFRPPADCRASAESLKDRLANVKKVMGLDEAYYPIVRLVKAKPVTGNDPKILQAIVALDIASCNHYIAAYKKDPETFIRAFRNEIEPSAPETQVLTAASDGALDAGKAIARE
jgi:hypothetical protein